jgi:ABC-type transport system substrate-binding protein
MVEDSTVAKKFTTALVASPDNRWGGTNRGGYSNPAYDRLSELYYAALDHAERNRIVVALVKIQTEDLPGLPLYYDLSATAHISALQGPLGNIFWNVDQWEWRG